MRMPKMRRWPQIRRLAAGGLALLVMTPAAGEAAAIPLRGVIEGFYGTPWQETQRLDILDFCRAHQLNAYIYAPKDDPWHRERWREPYPADKLQDLAQLVRRAKADKVRFIFAVSPGLDLSFAGEAGEKDRAAMLEKLSRMYELGVRDFAIFFDDIKDRDGAGQAAFLNDIRRDMAARHKDLGIFLTVPTEYYRQDMVTPDGARKPYTDAFAKTLSKDILVLYTGEGVVPPGITQDELQQADALYGRPLGIWWNYPVNDYMESKLALGPVTDLPRGGNIPAIFFNPMKYEALSKIALATGAAYARDSQKYDPERAWQQAIAEQYGPLHEDMARFADHSQHLENDWAKIGRPDGEALRQKTEALLQDWPSGATEERFAAAEEEIQALSASCRRLQLKLPKHVRDECRPQLLQFRRILAADETALALLRAKKAGQSGERLALHRSLRAQYRSIKEKEGMGRLSETSGVAFIERVLALP